MKIIIYLTVLILLLSGCDGNKTPEGAIVIDVENAKDYNFEEVTQDVKVIPIQSEYLLNAISSARCYGDDIFLISFNYCIYYISDGKVVSVLEPKGRGPGEYPSVSSIAYSAQKHELVVYSSTADKLYFYEAPSMKFKRGISVDEEIHLLEYLDEHTLIFSSISADMTASVNTIDLADHSITKIDLANKAVTKIMDSKLMPVSLSGDGSYSLNNGQIVFTIPGFINTIYAYKNNDLRKVADISFGDKNLEEEFYDYKDFGRGFSSFAQDFNKNKAVGLPLYPMLNEDGFTFWYVTKISFSIAPPLLQMYHQSNKGILEGKKLRIAGLNMDIQPTGVSDKYFMTLIQGPADKIIDTKTKLSELGSQIVEAVKSQTSDNPVMLLFSIK